MKCAGCLKPCSSASSLRCSVSSCEKAFCTLCVNPSTLTPDRKKNWRCPDCSAAHKKGGDNSATPIRPTHEDQNITMRKKEKESSSDTSQNDIKELVTEVRTLTHEIQSLKKKLEESTSSLSRCQERLDELVSAQKTSDARINRLEHRDEEFVLLQERVRQLERMQNAQAQAQLRNELEIIGIPETTNESLGHIVLIAARKIGVELTENDVDWVRRVGPRRAVTPENTFSRPVVVRLLRRGKRDQIIKASKSRRNITSKDLDVAGPVKKKYYNERLTKENRQLFREARAVSSRLGYKFCWCHQGEIYMRQREGYSAFHIQSKDDLQRVPEPIPTTDEILEESQPSADLQATPEEETTQ